MRLLLPIRFLSSLFLFFSLFLIISSHSYAAQESETIDRVQLVSQQISLLKNRLVQEQQELSVLQQNGKDLSASLLENANKGLLDKASLDISVSSSNLESINIELNDSQQTINWLEKNIQEMENQLNVLSIFGMKLSETDTIDVKQLHADLSYQKKLLALEKTRDNYLLTLQTTANAIQQLQKDRFSQINTYLKSRNLLHIKQQQVQDELSFQQQQNRWLQELEVLYTKLSKVSPSSPEYSEIERSIFYANEMANFAYYQSLIARYKDEIDQMRLADQHSSSITLLNEIGDQTQILNKQIGKLDGLIKSRIDILDKHITYLSEHKKTSTPIVVYLQKLNTLKEQYAMVEKTLSGLNTGLSGFRGNVDHDLQIELSARQGFPSFDLKSLLDIGREILLVPTLTFHMVKSMTAQLMDVSLNTSTVWWSFFILLESFLIAGFILARRSLEAFANKPSLWDGHLNSKWVCVQWFRRNFLDFFVLANATAFIFYFAIPVQVFLPVIYLSIVWAVLKSILTIARLCLVENMQDTHGEDMLVYKRLRWMIGLGGFITVVTVFAHQLPIIYELKALCDRLFLFLLMLLSLFLLRSWQIVPNLIMAEIDYQHPYFRRSMMLISILIPLIMLGNSIIGLFGYVNLILSVSWYEGVFLCVLIGYLIVRGLLSDGMEQVSRLVIQYVNNGWLWTEAILKPLDRILRISLFFMSWALLFLLYGWDNQSPIVVRLNDLLHYRLVKILNTPITPVSIIELCVVISVFYWAAKWTREFIFRILSSRTKDMGIRNSIAILSQYSVVVLGVFICLQLLGIDLRALAFVASMLALGIGMGLRDLINNFACGFLILLERPIRVGDIVNINSIEGEVAHIGSRAVTVRTWDNMHMLVPNTDIFNKSFINWTTHDNIVRCVTVITTNREDNPHEIKTIITKVLSENKDVLKEPGFEVLLKAINDTVMNFDVRYYVNVRQVRSRVSVMSAVLTQIWDSFAAHGIKPAYPYQEVLLKKEPAQLLHLTDNDEAIEPGVAG